MTFRSGPHPPLTFLLGKPLRPETVLAEVRALLQASSIAVTVLVPNSDAPLPSWLFDSTLIVQRGLSEGAISSAVQLVEAGIRCCNRIAATIAGRDRGLTMRRLAEAGLPTPATAPAATWRDVLVSATGGPVVIKAADEYIGRGQSVFVAATGSLPPQPPFAGPFVVQEYVGGNVRDYKVYVIGQRVHGLIKKSPAANDGDKLAVPFVVEPVLAELACRVGTALGLEIYGVDFLYGPRGLAIVDVNPFPGFRGVPKAAPLIADYLRSIAEEINQAGPPGGRSARPET